MKYRFMLALAAIVFCGESFAQTEDYQFASIELLFEQQVGAKVLPVIYSKLGLTISIVPMPGKRAQREAASGHKDGEIMRIWSYGKENPNLIRIPTPYYQLETMAFVHKDNHIVLTSQADLSKYSLLKVRGVKHTNIITADLRNVFDYNNTQTMMLALHDSPSSIALTNTSDGLYAIKKLNIDYVKALPPALATLDLYHYVNQKHAALVPRLDAVIKTMKQSGELDKLLRNAEAEVLASLGD
ncbi:substrate-binding periplasmic protein [Shewanella sp. HL-SH5]|uniref:substrate-binding periplasmic protein n=1 Tax=Shewanella sp. HL-SH5 TaxID=3436241 RepID=UPI003EBF3EB2